MQTSARPQATATIPTRLAIVARLLKNGNAAMSREDKAAFGIDIWNTSTDTPEELNKRVAEFLNALSVEHLVEKRPDFLFLENLPVNQCTGEEAAKLG